MLKNRQRDNDVCQSCHQEMTGIQLPEPQIIKRGQERAKEHLII